MQKKDTRKPADLLNLPAGDSIANNEIGKEYTQFPGQLFVVADGNVILFRPLVL